MRRQAPGVLAIAVWLAAVLAFPTAAHSADPPQRLLILLANDDGFDAPGLRALIDAFQPIADVVVAAPASEQSGKGHGLTLRDPIFVTERRQADGSSWYAVDGPPATCVRLAVEALLPRRPDLVISGINRGDNLGATVFHAGTLGAAREGAIVGIAAIAVSIRGDDPADYRAAAAYVRQLVDQLRDGGALRPGLFLNVNVPAGERKGVMMARLSTRPRHDTFEKRTSPRGRVYYWPDFRQLEDDEEGTDVWAFVRGYVTVTPMKLDVTDASAMRALAEIATKR